MHRKYLLLLALRLTEAFVPTLPRTARVICHSESHAAPAEPEPPVEAPPAAPPAETEDETLMTSLEAALVAEEASAAARSTMAQSSVQKLAAAERLRAEADAA